MQIDLSITVVRASLLCVALTVSAMIWMVPLLWISSILKALSTGERIRVVIKTGENGTENEVFMQINGTEGDVSKTELKIPIFESYSIKYYNFDDVVGDPYMVTVFKPGTNSWELEYLELGVGNKEFMFPCSCWMSDEVNDNVPEPRTRRLLRCYGNDVISIINATYGRWDNFTCPPSDNSSCENVDVLGIFQRHCNGMSQCDLKSFQDTYKSMFCVSSYTVIVFECITRAVWTITVKTGDRYPFSGIHNGRQIQLTDQKGRNQRFNLTGHFAVGSLKCFALESTITDPSELKVNGNPSDVWELKSISFSYDGRHIVFKCDCDIMETKQDFELDRVSVDEIYMADLEYCFKRTSVTVMVTSSTPVATTETPDSPPTSAVTFGASATSTIGTPLTSSMATTTTPNNTFFGTNASICPCDCGPSYYGDIGCSLDDVECVVSVLREQLIVDVKSTSSFKRTKISAYDVRTSSRMIGATGVVFLVVPLLVIVIPDCFKLFKYTCTKLGKSKTGSNHH